MGIVRTKPDVAGYPAWAGIDRAAVRFDHALDRLPRVGGDRPSWMLGSARNQPVTPRGRG